MVQLLIMNGGIEVPESVLLQREQGSKYGSVPGLDSKELVDPDELEKQVYAEMFGPVLQLPVQGPRSSFQPNVDEADRLDWGAFGTIDFQRLHPFDKARYKADKLREQLKNVLIMLSIVKDRLPGTAKYLVLKYLKQGVIGLEHIANDNMLSVAKWYLRARRLQQEIGELQEASREKRWGKAEGWVGAVG